MVQIIPNIFNSKCLGERLVGEIGRQIESAEELEASEVAARGRILVTNGCTTGGSGIEAERDDRSGSTAESEDDAAASRANVLRLHCFEAVTALIIDVADLDLLDDTGAGGSTLFRRHIGQYEGEGGRGQSTQRRVRCKVN